MFRTILWATDGSTNADEALPIAQELAREGKLVAVHCRETIVAGRGAGYPVLADDADLVAKIRGQVAALKAEGLDATVKVFSGGATTAAQVIADAAREAGADVIVVGTRGHGLVASLLVGSVTQRLLHVAPCPVLAVPTGKHAAVHAHEPEQAVSVV